jgi:hypothetical protein
VIQPPDITEYLTALRLRSRFIVLVAVLCALAIGGLTAFRQEPKVQVGYWIGDSGDRGIATLLGAPASIVPAFNVDVIIGEIKIDILANHHDRWEAGLISVGTTGSGNQLVVNVVDEREEVSRALALEILDRAVQRHRTEFQSNLNRIEAATAERVTYLVSEISDLRTSSSMNSGVETFMVYSELLGHQRMLAGLDQMRLSDTGGITDPTQLGIAKETDLRSPITFGLLGLILGMVLAGAITVTRRFFEPRILSAEDIERAVFVPRFIEVIRSLDPTAGSSPFIGLAAAVSMGLDSSRSQAIQLVGAPGSFDLPTISSGLAEALDSLGLRSDSFEIATQDKTLSETLAIAAEQITKSQGIAVLATMPLADDLADAVAIGRLATRSVVVVSAGETRLSELSEIVREFEVSGIDCDGILIVSN